MTNSEQSNHTMADSQIVVLGDYIATGQGLLWPEIIGDRDIVFDDMEVANNNEFEQKLVSWYLKNNNAKVDFESVIKHSHESQIQKEKDLSWVSHIPNCLNLAVAVETFQGMHKKIKTILTGNTKPSMVLITCVAEEHRCVVINHDNKQFVVNKDIKFWERDKHKWPSQIYQKFMIMFNQQELLGAQFQRRKNKKSFDMLTRLLDNHQVPYKFLLFRQCNSYISTQYVDLSDLDAIYRTHDERELLTKKLEVQPEIARRVMAAVGV
tara:strand:- start:349 stop:1146 length:798 start_codon:yes stop_codon:yes gene_type:complete